MSYLAPDSTAIKVSQPLPGLCLTKVYGLWWQIESSMNSENLSSIFANFIKDLFASPGHSV